MVFPARCPLCDGIMEYGKRGLCEKCRYSMPYITEPVCLKCGREIADEGAEYCPDCGRSNSRIKKGFPLLSYVEPAASSVLRLKYNGRQEYAGFYAAEIAKKYGDVFKYLDIDVLIPVPLYKRKYRDRGFNQAELIAEQISALTGIPMDGRLLTRVRDTAPLKALNRIERAESMATAFAVTGENRYRKIMLVDDIYTTGATMEACAGALYAAGAEEVYFTSVCIGRS